MQQELKPCFCHSIIWYTSFNLENKWFQIRISFLFRSHSLNILARNEIFIISSLRHPPPPSFQKKAKNPSSLNFKKYLPTAVCIFEGWGCVVFLRVERWRGNSEQFIFIFYDSTKKKQKQLNQNHTQLKRIINYHALIYLFFFVEIVLIIY